ncbi:pentatricopeptide repeat-containing protein At3g16610-like [Selaginella moellendorffii]|uniref:pentatricopeptide repeat-containing protein At3g16610-like n=1 Tax=Selaginella moellendorffii TaxID=88036 RepID=UPI000D1D0F46|nr:pentatricopeptide repeat-containing protein At3g16610-like [Selaginella moellendorffii]|eukprot:XP_024541009.1 pentatricopeptide repeat-containing protein At3g16610-like [Selaginella moellendorffii]
MYMKCGSVVEAQQAFDRIPRPDEVAMRRMARTRWPCSSLDRYNSAAQQTHELLPLRSPLAAAEEGHRQAEAGMRTDPILCNVYMRNALIDMYVKCRSMVHAQEVFDKMKSRDVVSWNVLMLGYTQDGLGAKEEARNPQEKLRFLVTGVAIHGTADRLRCDSNIFIANALLN